MYRNFQQIFTKLLKFVVLRTILGCTACGRKILQMISKNRVQSIVSALLSSRYRKFTLAIIVLLLFFIYFSPNIFNLQKRPLRTNRLERCIEDKLDVHRRLQQSKDAVINDVGNDIVDQTFYPAYYGNGKFGGSLTEDLVYLKYQRSLSVPLNFAPSLSVYVEGYEAREANAIHFRDGVATRVQCFKRTSLCISAVISTFAHRSRPSILVQELKIYNPTSADIKAELVLTAAANWNGYENTKVKEKNRFGEDLTYNVAVGGVVIPDDATKSYIVSVAYPVLPTALFIKSGKSEKLLVVMSIDYSEPVPTSPLPKSSSATTSPADRTRAAVRIKCLQDLREALMADGLTLRKEHSTVWNKIWQTGFGISHSLAPGALNGARINATIYYVLSHSTSPRYELSVEKERKEKLETLLHTPDKCYAGHHTLQASTLWSEVSTGLDISRLVKTWIITLEKQGCNSMLQSGAEGVLQSMVLSLGGLKFTSEHLEFNTHPQDLHRDYHFRRVLYGAGTHLNITVRLNDENKAELYVSKQGDDVRYGAFYACDAGCVDAPVKLGSTPVGFPVKQTQPMTAILYITSDRVHIEELQHAIHVKEIVEAPAHEHQIIALHKHGHLYGGLPMLFWLSIAFLVIIFHLFLFKIIYTEYCLGQVPSYSRGKYNM